MFIFHLSQVNDYIQNLKEFYQAEPLQTSREAENKNAMESVNTKWQESIEKFFSTENLGRVFLNLVNTVRFLCHGVTTFLME